MISAETILITGGAGFIGARLAEELCRRNKVRIFDTFGRSPMSSFRLANDPNIELIQGDVRDRAALAKAAQGVDRIAHLASIAGVSTVINNPVLTMDVVLNGTSNVLAVAKDVPDLKRVAVFSTSEVFGRFAFNVSEDDPTPIGQVGESRWTYAASKIGAEHLANAYFREFGVPAVSLRPFNVYGPGQIGEGAIHHFIRSAIHNEPILVNNDGRQIRSWCYVDDMVSGTIKALVELKAVGQAFNIGNPAASVNVVRLAELIVRLAESKSEIKFRRRDYPDVEMRVPSIEKARELLGFEPSVKLEDGILATIRAYREQLT